MEYDGETIEYGEDTILQMRSEQGGDAIYRSGFDAFFDDFSSFQKPQMKAQDNLEEKQPRFNHIPRDQFSPSQPPLWVQPYTSFPVQDSAESILRRCSQFMRNHQTLTIDFDYRGDCCIRGIIYRSDKRSATVVLSIFHHPSALGVPVHLVELNRLAGDSIVFRTFYDELAMFLKPVENMGPSDDWDFCVEPMEDVSHDISVDIALDSNAVSTIIELASSPKVDQAREGVALLATCASSQRSQEEILASPWLEAVLQRSLTSSDVELARFASLCLLNLLTQETYKAQILAKGLSGYLIDLLSERERLETLETNRQAATCLLKLAVGDLLVTADLSKINSTMAQLSDPTTKDYLQLASRSVQV